LIELPLPAPLEQGKLEEFRICYNMREGGSQPTYLPLSTGDDDYCEDYRNCDTAGGHDQFDTFDAVRTLGLSAAHVANVGVEPESSSKSITRGGEDESKSSIRRGNSEAGQLSPLSCKTGNLPLLNWKLLKLCA